MLVSNVVDMPDSGWCMNLRDIIGFSLGTCHMSHTTPFTATICHAMRLPSDASRYDWATRA
jgi:hypothetical protein